MRNRRGGYESSARTVDDLVPPPSAQPTAENDAAYREQAEATIADLRARVSHYEARLVHAPYSLRDRVLSLANEWERRADAAAITYQDAAQRARAIALPRAWVAQLREVVETDDIATGRAFPPAKANGAADYATPSPDATPSPAETLRRAATRVRRFLDERQRPQLFAPRGFFPIDVLAVLTRTGDRLLASDLRTLLDALARVEALADYPQGDCEGHPCIWPEDILAALFGEGQS